MSRVPAPSRRVLTALIEGLQAPILPPPAQTSVGRRFDELLALLNQQDKAVVALDRLAPQVDGKEEAEAAYRSAVAQEARLADATADTAAALLLAPVERAYDLQLKLMVLIAACEPHPEDAFVFPGLYLRTLLADLRNRPLSTERDLIDHDRCNVNS